MDPRPLPAVRYRQTPFFAAAVGAEKIRNANKRAFGFDDGGNAPIQTLGRYRFGQIFGHAGVPGLNDPTRLAMGRHHDDRDKGIAAVRIGADFIEQSNAVETGRPVVQNDVGGLVVEFLEPRFSTGGVINFIRGCPRSLPLICYFDPLPKLSQ